jgi:AGCS family alanine or glycine:cation symporter
MQLIPIIVLQVVFYAVGYALGAIKLGGCIAETSVVLFAFTTIVGWNYYGEKCVWFLSRKGAIIL